MTKTTKCTSGYGSSPEGFSCGVCNHFMRPSGCELVDGEIHPSDCCNLFDNPNFRSSCKKQPRYMRRKPKYG